MDKRFFLTILLCMGIFFLWSAVIQPWIWPKPKAVPPPAAPAPAPVVKPAETPVVKPAEAIPEAKPLDPIPLETERFVAVFHNRGAVLDELYVKHGAEKIKLIESTRKRVSSFYIEGLGHYWEKSAQTPTSITFKTQKGGLEYEKEFVLAPPGKDAGLHVFQVNLKIRNISDSNQDAKIAMFAFNGIVRDSDYRYESYLQGYWGVQPSNGPVAFKSYDWAHTHEQPKQDAGRVACALKNRYFALVLMTPAPQSVESYEPQGMGPDELQESQGFKNIKLKLETTSITIAKGGSPLDLNFQVYAGPIHHPELEEAPRPIGNLLDYTGFDFIGIFILGILNFFKGIFGSYGVAIIFTTIAMKLCLFLLNKKSQVSMFKMSQLSPKIEALKLKYANDPQKLGQEQWKLFREEKISPVSGCLPMLIQLPIFLAMYSVLDISVDLRHQPFLWFSDLSQPDRLVDFGHKIFWEVESLNLLPILMTIVWVAQSMMAPKSKDPQMQMNQKMMQFMPLLFGVMCYNLAAGLSWYFLFNALLGMAEQRLIKKFFLKPSGAPLIGAKPGTL